MLTRSSDAEKRADLRLPRQQGELVYRANHKAGRIVVDILVNDIDRKRSIMIFAAGVLAAKAHGLRPVRTELPIVAQHFLRASPCRFLSRTKLGAAPRAFQQHEGVLLSLRILREILETNDSILAPVRRRIPADPHPERKLLVSKPLDVIGLEPEMFHSAEKQSGALELLRRQQSKRVSHQHISAT